MSKNMDEIPTTNTEKLEYLKECYDDLQKFTSKTSQEIIQARIDRCLNS